MEKLSDGNIVSKLDSKSLLLTIKEPTSKKRLIDIFKDMEIDIEDMLVGYEGYFDIGQVELTGIDDKLIFVYKREKYYFITLKDERVISIDVGSEESEFRYLEDGSESTDIFRIKEFVDILADLKREYPTLLLYDLFCLYDGANLINEFNYYTVIEDEEVLLMIPYFRNHTDLWKRLSIVLKTTKEDVGYIEFSLSEDNFQYIGNVEYEIKEKYRRRGYATRALSLVKRLVAEYESEVDKCLYITTEMNNKASQKVILKNGGILFYEGEVPNGDKVKFLNKVDYVKIYTIDANTICES